MAESEMKTLAIVGGGAAGLAAAVAAGERARAKGASLEITIYERDDRVGRSILATGNGRCNFSNAKLDASAYRSSAFVQDALRGLSASFDATEDERYGKIRRDNGDDVHAFFCRHGLMWRVEDDGREYPLPNKASVVVDVLRAAAADAGAREVCGCVVAAVEPPRSEGGRFTLRMADGRLERADAVILASGHAAQSLEAAGLNVPKDVMLTGFADLPVASLMTPTLTTVHQNRELLAQTAFRRLMDRIREPDLPPCDIFIPSNIVVRESSSRTKTTAKTKGAKRGN